MKITRARVLAYDVALRKPLVTSTSTINRRNGFLLELGGSGRVEHAAADRRGSADLRGYGEAAPVWWLGEGTVEEAGAALRRAAELVSSAAAEADDWLALLRAIDVAGATADEACVAGARSDWSTALSRCWSGWPPSVRSAVVTAVLDVGARLRGSSVAELLADGSVATRLATSRLLAGEDERALASSAAAAVEAGFESVKLKVGAYPPQRDAARLRLVRDVVGPEVAIRLDANRAWEPRDAGTALEQMAGCSPQLVEEPLRDAEPEALARLRGCGVPIALDESIATLHELERHLRAGAIDFAIVKLGRVGGPLRARALAGAAAARGLATIVTDSIETAVGQAAALHVAAGLAGPAHAVGLGGAAMLMGDDVARSLFAAPLVTLPTPGLTGAWDPRPVACRA